MEYVGDMRQVRYNVASRNREVVGICLTGDFSATWPSTLQLAAASELVEYLLGILPGRQVVGHRDIALAAYATSCPGDTWTDWRGILED